jgi:large subunit ribosomal protein L15
MGTTLHTLSPNPGATRDRKRLGRGHGSGLHKTSGKGQKGQKARTGHHGARLGFEGGQMPMQRRFPKKGFKNPFRTELFAVNVGALEERFAGGTVDLKTLQDAGMVPRGRSTVKILGDGNLTKKLVVKATAFSASAKEKIEKAGGTAEVVAS